MDDLISREEAVRALGDAHFKNYGNAIMVIQALPSEEPKKGKWIHRGTAMICSVCETMYYDRIMEHFGGEYPKYCPECGADMMETREQPTVVGTDGNYDSDRR